MHRLDPGAHSLEQRHDGELVVLVLAGCGKLLIDGGPQRFAAPCTVVVPPKVTFQFVNHGSEPLQLVAALAAGEAAAVLCAGLCGPGQDHPPTTPQDPPPVTQAGTTRQAGTQWGN